ncbi:MAG: T9SS type A sorting domain-containing protein [Cyclobacteriaceae bacterium]|nr:T9SS type A sorting domain-containing protein [Cyclobacteriaceae bacterium]
MRLETWNLWSPTPVSVTIYSGVCGSLTEIFCLQLDEARSFFDPIMAGETVFIRIYNFDTEEGGEFELCIYAPDEPPNDNCDEAFEIEVTESCNRVTFTNGLATFQPESVAPDPSCGVYRGGDVWFKAVMPTSENLRLETNNLTGVNAHSVTLYNGACGSLTEKFCIQLDEKETFHAPDLAGQIRYLRFFTYSNEEGGPFDLCIFEPVCRDTVVDAGTLTLCRGESFAFGSQVADKPGIYLELFETAEGCDSLVYLTISINPVYESEESFTLCPGEIYTFPDGMVHDKIFTGKIHTSHLLTSQGCDSLIETTLRVREIDNSVSQIGLTLTANEDSATYQWIDCSIGSMPLPGEVGQIFNGEAGKDYSVEITREGCTYISDCYRIEVVGLEKENDRGIRIYPNPVNSSLSIDSHTYQEDLFLELTGINGQSVVSGYKMVKPISVLDVDHLPAGPYILGIATGNKIIRIRIIKE